METNHQLVDHGADNGTKERGEKGHQEPAISDPEWTQRQLLLVVIVKQLQINISWFMENASAQKITRFFCLIFWYDHWIPPFVINA